MTTVHFTIGITGGSGSGKTRFITELARRFASGELCVVSQDHYYKPIENQVADAKGIENFDLPTAIDHEQFLRDIQQIKKGDRKSTRLNSSHVKISYAVFCLKKK